MAGVAAYFQSRREFFALLAKAAAIVLAYGVAAEIVLRFLPVPSGLEPILVDDAHPIMHFEPNHGYVDSRGWKLADANRGWINNAGWVNDQDYHRESSRPLIAVLDSSFVEALMVRYADTVQGRLAAALSGSYRVYSFGVSGGLLAQDVMECRYAEQQYGAAAAVIIIPAYNFAKERPPGLWDYTGERGSLALHLVRNTRRWWQTITNQSALLRYVRFNLDIAGHLEALRQRLRGAFGALIHRADDPQRPASPVLPSRDLNHLESGVAAADAVVAAFFRDLPALCRLPPERVLFVLDGFRYPERAARLAGRFTDRVRRDFTAAAADHGYAVLDLDPPFFAHYRATGERFEFPHDDHWNAAGHAVAAEAILGSSWLEQLRASEP